MTSLHQWQQQLLLRDPNKVKLGLPRVRQALNALNIEPPKQIILVAGTNGKGSAVALLQSILINKGLTVGSYTSPHLQRINERFCIQGQQAQDQQLVDAFDLVGQTQGSEQLSYFEFLTIASVALFSLQQVEIGLFEVGLGGRLDAVNTLDPDISVVTGIDLDHTNILGNNREHIGFEKAGIYRAEKPAIFCSANRPQSLTQHVESIAASPYYFGQHIVIEPANQTANQLTVQLAATPKQRAQTVTLDLGNAVQIWPQDSLLAALAVTHWLGFCIDQQALMSIEQCQLQGRYQHLTLAGTQVILDVAHNVQAVQLLQQRLITQSVTPQAALFAAMADKDLTDICQPFIASVKQWFLLELDTERAATFEQMKQCLLQQGLAASQIIKLTHVKDMQQYLQQLSTLLVFGSFYTVGQFLDYYGERVG